MPIENMIRGQSTQPDVAEELASSLTQESGWITPGQRIRASVRSELGQKQLQKGFSLQNSCFAFPGNTQPSVPSNSQFPNFASDVTDTSFSKLINFLLSLLVGLILARTQSAKIQCLLELSSLFNAETTVTTLLAEMGHSSLTSSQ